MSDYSIEPDPNSIAVIGMSCRVAGASSVGEFWANLTAGRESIRDLFDAQLHEAGVSPEAAANKYYVRRASSLDGVEMFDARFFDFTPREAAITAPSQRLLLMCAHEAFEDAGYDPRNGNPNVGVFAGVNRCDDWQKRLYELADSESGEFAKQLQLYIANDLDYAATRISYKFDLKGPSVNVGTACSTSLVAIHQACRSLLSYECDMALAGGASVVLPQDAGYLHEPGGVRSHDGRCRAFDADANGTVFGNGAGMVLLKRLGEALADRDNIHAVIRGTAINNDGAAKVGYTAPSVQGQSQVILAALAFAGVDPADIGYVEAHGTGTSLGDPIEIEALTRAYHARTQRKRYCALGSVKTNIGHLGAAAGVAGFIKTVLALKHRQIPASLHYQAPNPEIDFDNSPFVVSTALTPWVTSGQPRLAGLSSFGVGGTNAHAILQEAPPRPSTNGSRSHQLLTLSAASPTALDAQVRRLLDALRAAPGLDLADVAYTLNTGRSALEYRAAIVAADRDEAIAKLSEVGAGQSFTVLAKSFDGPDADLVIAACCRDAKQGAGTDLSVLLQALGRAWSAGRTVDWKAFYAGEQRARVSLPTYPFEGQRHWLERAPRRTRAAQAGATAAPVQETAADTAKPASALAQRLAGAAPEARQDLMEVFVGERVRELLGMAQAADADTAFVELGLSSLMAIELRTELNAALQADHVSIIQLLDENTNVRTLAAHVLNAICAVPAPAADAATPSQQQAAPVAQAALAAPAPETSASSEASEFGSAVKSIEPDLDSQFLPFPLTDIQQAYWIGRHNTGSGGNVATYAYIETEIRDLDVARYEAALNEMVQRHHMLRMVVQEDGQQRFLPEVPAYRIPVEDLSTLGPEEAEARLMATRARMSHQVLDLTIWPLFQLRISKITPSGYRLHYGFDFMIMDAMSLLLFFRDMFLLYTGEQDRLTPLRLSFRDYVLAEKANRGSEQFQRSRQYWLDRVPTLAAAPSLPMTCDPSAIAVPRYARRDFELDRDTWSKLKAQARMYKVTPSVLIATAYAEVLAKWCAAPRFTLNLSVFNRPRLHPQMNDLIGDFSSTVLLEIDMARVEAFETSARSIQNRLMQDLEHRHFGGVEVLRALNSQMGGYQSVVMPIVLTSALGLDQHAESRLAGLDESKLQVFEEMMNLGHTISQTSQVWLDHVVREKNGALLCNWDALEEIFPPRMLDEMFCAYYDRLIQLSSEGDAAWRSLRPTALPDAQQRARDGVNATQAPVCEDLLQTLFERQARKTPDALAVVNGDVRLTYRDLLVLATHLGLSLRAQGVRPNELVAVVMEKGWEQIVAVFGILFSGAAYMPVDAALPAERVRQLLAQGEVRIALTQTRLLERIDWPGDVHAQAIDRRQIGDSARRGDEPVALTPVQDAGDLAYVLFTSGSTGVPKGVMVDHRGVVNTVLDTNQRFGITSADRTIAISALNFDLSVYDVFGLLSAGGALVMPLAERLLDASHWSELVLAERVTFWNTVPAIAQLYVEELEARGAGGRQPQQASEALRLVFMGGDWIPVSLPDRIRAVLPVAQPVSVGGPTETTLWSIFYPIGRVEPGWKSIPYGKPFNNRTHHVLHADMSDCPDWVPGDIYTGGRIGLSKGYWRDEEKTNQLFIRHPITGEPIYKTGDLGRFLPDGNIEFIGRSDHQVKLHGHRIELGEIEHALLCCDGVHDAVVMAVSDSDAQRSSQRLVAYVVERENADDGASIADLMASEGAPDPTQAWRDALRARLPYYMVPASFVRLKRFPLTANGKVNRKKLADSGSTDAQALEQREATLPRDALETAVHAAWLRVLEIAEADIRDNLFELGGDSLIATKIIAELTRTLGLNLPVHQVFSDPTIEGMATRYRALQTGSAIEEAPAGGLATAEQVFGDFRAVTAQLVREAAQDLPIISEQSSTADIANPKAILLTGASGFLGAHVLHELLQRTTATVLCLVRGKDRAECMRRIEDNLARHGFDPAPHRDRIQALSGDLARPELGLAASEHAQVCADVDVIYHVGAAVNFARSYADMKGANVGSARSIIALAATGKRKAIVYVSSKFVCFRLDKHGVTILQQEGRIARPDGLFSAYSQGKWVAEKLFERAGDAGIPVAIVRPGQISASAQGRLHLPDDPFHQLVDLFRGLGTKPREGEWSDGAIDVVPVDYCAAAIAAIGLRADSYGRHFHLVNPQPMPMDDFLSALAALSGRPASHAGSFEAWADDCLAAVRRMDDKVSASVLEKFFLATEHGRYIKGMSIDAKLAQENVRAALTGSGITCPPVTADLWRRYLQARPDNATPTGGDTRRAADLPV